MRLLGRIEDQKQFVQFRAFLEQKGIGTKLEPTGESGVFDIWVEEEDQFDRARAWLAEYLKDPKNRKFHTAPSLFSAASTVDDTRELTPPSQLRTKKQRFEKHMRAPLTKCIILLCALLYAWNGYQYMRLSQEKSGAIFYNLTPLFMQLCYDLPSVFPLYVQFFKGRSIDSFEELKKIEAQDAAFRKIQSTPHWKGIYHLMLNPSHARRDLNVPLFVKLRQKQLWRIITPALMHGNLLHIFFNMLCLYLLGGQIEERVKRWQYLSITLMIAAFSNTLQYLMSGPLFLGYSGVITGLAGFIWVRQKRAPWEGYSVSRSTLIFLMAYIFGMLALGILSFVLTKATTSDLPFNIANTAHVSGAMIGAIFGRISPLSRAKL